MYSPFRTRTEGGKVEVEVGRAMIVTAKLDKRRERTMKGPRLPPAWWGEGGLAGGFVGGREEGGERGMGGLHRLRRCS